MSTTSRKATCFALLMAFATGGVCAAGREDGDFLDLLDQENQVFAASRYVQTLAETPANVSVISHDDITLFGYRTIADALYSLPGFYNAASQWPSLGLRGIAVPGDFGSRVLYMINGMPIYEPTYGGFFLEYLDISSIDRIEVVRGSGSALYGSGAVMGIINLVTRNGHDTPGNTAIVEAGSHGSYSAYGSTAAVVGPGLDMFASASISGGKGRDIYLSEFGGTSIENDGQKNTRVFLRLANENFWVQAIYVDGAKHDPMASYNTTFNADQLLLREQFGALETGFNHKLDNDARLTGRAYIFDVAERGDYPYRRDSSRFGSPDYINVTDIKSQTSGVELRYDKFVSERHHLLAGLESRHIGACHEIGDQPALERAGVITVRGNPSYSQHSFFVQDEWRFNDKRRIFFGVRFDSYHGFSPGVSHHLSPRIALVQDFGGGNTGKLIFGEAYRAPTNYESLFTDLTPDGTITLWKNPQLQPEITRSLEAVWEHAPSKGLNLSLGAYLTQTRNSPEQVRVDAFEGQNCPAPGTCNQYQDSHDKLQVIGIEAAAKWKREDRLSAYVSVTLQKATEQPGPPSSSPRYLLKGGISHPLWHRWHASAEVQAVGATDGLRNADGTRTASTPAYVLVNAALAHQNLGRGWRASLHINNLFDSKSYTVASRELQPIERVPAAGRTLSLQVRKDF
jgi:iron complex outermembrane receptor protein